uniref:Sodium voltage-gated channel beta subunit 4 n=1 Tax=Malurus cyaneus samueli TaxID=2593467 RepID=A0A8C5THY4_9PASS
MPHHTNGTGPWWDGDGERGCSSGRDQTSLCLHICAIAIALEVSVGKTNTVMALNNSNVLLPCTFTTCIGFQDLVFTWYFNSTEMIYHGKIKNKATEPTLISRNPRVEFVGSTTKKDNNISIVLNGVEFSDAGKYTCHVKNPKEKNAQHNATIFLTVVHKMVETDNTVTVIIVSVVGGLIGLLILFMLIKRVVLFIIKKTQDGKAGVCEWTHKDVRHAGGKPPLRC